MYKKGGGKAGRHNNVQNEKNILALSYIVVQAPTQQSSLLSPPCLHILWPLSHVKVGRGATTAGTSLSTTRHSVKFTQLYF